jgi:hypothetical protein
MSDTHLNEISDWKSVCKFAVEQLNREADSLDSRSEEEAKGWNWVCEVVPNQKHQI